MPCGSAILISAKYDCQPKCHTCGDFRLVHEDLNEEESCSRAGSHHFLSEDIPLPPNNGAIHNVAEIIKGVMSSAAEAELGAMYINARKAVEERIILEEMGHKQPATPVQVDNSTAEGIINKRVQPKRTKAMDMRFHWLRDRSMQKQFRFYWRPGPTNYQATQTLQTLHMERVLKISIIKRGDNNGYSLARESICPIGGILDSAKQDLTALPVGSSECDSNSNKILCNIGGGVCLEYSHGIRDAYFLGEIHPPKRGMRVISLPAKPGIISAQSRLPRRRPPQGRDPRPRLARARAPHTHGNEFLARRGMYRDARIQVGLRAPHLHGHAEALHHLVGAHPEDVHPHDLLVDARAHELHQSLGFVLRFHVEYPVVEVAEFGRVHSDVAASVLFDRPGLGQAARADGLQTTFARARNTASASPIA